MLPELSKINGLIGLFDELGELTRSRTVGDMAQALARHGPEPIVARQYRLGDGTSQLIPPASSASHRTKGACRYRRRKWPSLGVLLATSYADLPRLSKPYHQAQLQAEINKLLAH